jgi:lipoprotein-releasing system ATP-binding protein
MAPDSPIAVLENVCRDFQSSPDAPVQHVLRGITLTIGQGETIAITGPSGCGKSTLLNLLGTLDRPTSGSLTLFGHNPAVMNEAQLSELRARHIGFVFQSHHLLPHLTALENVLVPVLAGHHAPDMKTARSRASDLLTRVGLAAHASKMPAQLSGGERQRVAVVRALIRDPRLILADEPTGALDTGSATSLIDLLLDLQAESGSSLVMVTHDPGAAARMQRHLRLRDGLFA